ncbi:MAG: non-ribosomal peptide synthetase, partial [Cyanothece sp. SIO2G6]|nr:non-ribosomal peptide synthetase [Cyanothece sp. SIO2G6]
MSQAQQKQQAIAKKLAEVPVHKRNALLKRLQQDGINPMSLPIIPHTPTDNIPLSWSQERLWFLDQLEEASTIYNLPMAMWVDGLFPLDRLQTVLDAIVQRHKILTTTFHTIEEESVQVLHQDGHWPVEVIDKRDRHLATHAGLQNTELKELIQQEFAKPFDLMTGPLVRATVVQLSDTESILILNRHHIVWDGWSTDQFLREFSLLFTAYSQSQAPSLPNLPIQYADYAVWQRLWFIAETRNQQLTYWQQQLANIPALLPLPTDYPRPAVQRYQGRTQRIPLPPELSQQIKALAQKQGVTLFMALLTGFQILLYRYSGQEDIVVGSPIANRQRPELEELIGFFVNTLALRSQITDCITVTELFQTVRAMTLDAYAHQDVPFEQIVDVLNPERSLAHSPLFQVMFLMQTPSEKIELPGITITPLEIENTIAKFDLTLTMEDTEQGLVGYWEYNSDLFVAETITRMGHHFATLLQGMVQDDSQTVAQLPLLSAIEQQQLLTGWNDTAVAYPTDSCIHSLFEAQVERTPEAIALQFETQS